MVTVKAPLRISLGGGGTDIPAYYRLFGGFLVSAAIDKYVQVSLNEASDGIWKTRYLGKEHKASSVEGISDTFTKQVLKLLQINTPLEITSVSDIEPGSGLGSSGSFLVALLLALHEFKGQKISRQKLAEEAFYIEAEILKKPVGKQDQYLASFGGFTQLRINKEGKVAVRILDLDKTTLKKLKKSLVVFDTRLKKPSQAVLAEQSLVIKKSPEVQQSMGFIKEIGREIDQNLKLGNIEQIGYLMDKHWNYKKQVLKAMTDPQIDDLYETGKKAGALGGKIIGAGGRGFLLFVCPKNADNLRFAMKDKLTELKFDFDLKGARVLT